MSKKQQQQQAQMRTVFLGIRMTVDEKTFVSRAALAEKLDISIWARRVLLIEAEKLLHEKVVQYG
jgi:uncharacterized protein (DUF1778 family)